MDVIQKKLTALDIIFWLRENYKMGKSGSTSKNTVYQHYIDMCHERNVEPSISATYFGKLVKRAFPDVKYNRKGPRGGTKQHYTHLKRIDPSKKLERQHLQQMPAELQQEYNYYHAINLEKEKEELAPRMFGVFKMHHQHHPQQQQQQQHQLQHPQLHQQHPLHQLHQHPQHPRMMSGGPPLDSGGGMVPSLSAMYASALEVEREEELNRTQVTHHGHPPPPPPHHQHHQLHHPPPSFPRALLNDENAAALAYYAQPHYVGAPNGDLSGYDTGAPPMWPPQHPHPSHPPTQPSTTTTPTASGGAHHAHAHAHAHSPLSSPPSSSSSSYRHHYGLPSHPPPAPLYDAQPPSSSPSSSASSASSSSTGDIPYTSLPPLQMGSQPAPPLHSPSSFSLSNMQSHHQHHHPPPQLHPPQLHPHHFNNNNHNNNNINNHNNNNINTTPYRMTPSTIADGSDERSREQTAQQREDGSPSKPLI